MKHIITIQHAQSEQHVNGMIGSWTDWDLTELGKEHAENIGRKLSAELQGQACAQAWKIYSSDLLRTRRTAEPLARYMGLEVEYLPKLREHNIGEACGKSKEWCNQHRNWPLHSFDDRLFPSAESWREFWDRVTEVCNEIIADEAENIILVAHGGTLAVWHHAWLGEEVQDCKFGPAGGASFMEMDDTRKRVITRLNDRSYML